MSSQSPQRTRKQQLLSGANVPSGPVSNILREPSPSPSLRERQQRNARTQSMPIVTPLTQIQNSPTHQPPTLKQQHQHTPPSPASSFMPVATSYQDHRSDNDDDDGDDDDDDGLELTQRPPLQHSRSFSGVASIHQTAALSSNSYQHQQHHPLHHHQQQQQGQASHVYPMLGYPRPVQRIPPPQFLSRLADESGEWQMTEELKADIERADILHQHAQHQPPAPGTEGVAYAGGAASFGRYLASGSPPKAGEPTTVTPSASTAITGMTSQKDQEGGHASGGSTGRRHSQPTYIPGQAPAQQRAREGSTATITMATIVNGGLPSPASLGHSRVPKSNSRPLTPENHPRGSPTTYYGANGSGTSNQVWTPPAAQRGGRAVTVEASSPPSHPNISSPARAHKVRTPDRSLPVQEEPDEHEPVHQRKSPPMPSEHDSSKDHHKQSPREWNGRKDGYADEHDGEGTLVDVGDDSSHPGQQAGSGIHAQGSSGDDSTEDGDGTHTPRSPSAGLFEHPHVETPSNVGMRGIHEVLQTDVKSKPNQKKSIQETPTLSFDATYFQETLKKLQSGGTNPTGNNNGNGNGLVNANTSAERNARMHYPPQPVFSRNESRSSYPDWIPGYYQQPDEQDIYDETAAYLQQYIQTPISTHMNHRPDAPIPPTPHSQTAAPTPFQQAGFPMHEPIPHTLVPPFSPAPPGGTPYPYPFSHVHRGYSYPSHPMGGRVTSSIYDPSVVQEQLALQMQMYAFNNAGAITDSTLSPSSTPYPGMGPAYSPFSAFLAQTRNFQRARLQYQQQLVGDSNGEDGRFTSASIRSSPSHMPVPLPPLRGRGIKKRDRFENDQDNVTGPGVGGASARQSQRVKPPPRVESTQPRDTSPEPSSSGEETAGEKIGLADLAGSLNSQEWPTSGSGVEEENGEWVEDDSEDENDLLDLEFHPSYVNNPVRRRKRWDQRWNDLTRAFQALDRETDATLILLAAPSHTNTLHSISSRSVRRDASLFDGHAMNDIKAHFGQIASQRRTARTQRTSLLERLYASSAAHLSGSNGTGAGDDSPSSTASREEDLRRALKTAIDSLGAMRRMYEMREARWREEERRMRDEREGMDLLLQQTFGSSYIGVGNRDGIRQAF